MIIIPNLGKIPYGMMRAVLICSLASGCAENETDGPVKTEKKSQAASQSTHKEVGEASWYGPGFHGRETASGEVFDQREMTAAHPTLPLGTDVEVTNLENKKKVEVEITDRGPYAKDRVIDLSKEAAKKLDMKEEGVSKVKIEATEPVKKSESRKAASAQSKKKPKGKTLTKSAEKQSKPTKKKIAANSSDEARK
jgi:rare lipoprotein A